MVGMDGGAIVIRTDHAKLGAVVAGFVGEVSVGDARLNDVRAPHDDVLGVEPVRALARFSLDAPGDRLPGRQVAVPWIEKREIGGLANRQNDRIGLDDGALVFIKDLIETPILVEDAQAALELHASDLAIYVAQDACRADAVVTNDALFISFTDLDFVGRHLGPAAGQANMPSLRSSLPGGNTQGHPANRVALAKQRNCEDSREDT